MSPFTGAYRPEGRLAVLNGENISGAWILRVCDSSSGDEGTIDNWSLDFNFGSIAFNNAVVANGSTLTPGSDLTVNGNLTVDAGGALNMGAHTLAVTGVFANNGTLDQQQSVTGSEDVAFFGTGDFNDAPVAAIQRRRLRRLRQCHP